LMFGSRVAWWASFLGAGTTLAGSAWRYAGWSVLYPAIHGRVVIPGFQARLMYAFFELTVSLLAVRFLLRNRMSLFRASARPPTETLASPPYSGFGSPVDQYLPSKEAAVGFLLFPAKAVFITCIPFAYLFTTLAGPRAGNIADPIAGIWSCSTFIILLGAIIQYQIGDQIGAKRSLKTVAYPLLCLFIPGLILTVILGIFGR